ncbi:MAG: HesA/MoeB/ThiF family protein [Sediminicola sp.]
MNPQRYTRQTSLNDFGPVAQQRLTEARVLVVGIGGLGIPVLQYLNAMGVGTLGIMDHDTVDMSNLQRQVLYSESDIGKSKLQVALRILRAQNSETHFKPYDVFLNPENALDIINDFDVVVDASDNFATRYLVNDACVILGKPFVYGALHGFEGQVSVFNYNNGPTYRCLFPTIPGANEVPNCDDNGVLGVVPGIIGTLQALETVKVISGVGKVLSGKLLLFDALEQSYQKIGFNLRPENLKITGLLTSYGENFCGTPYDIGAVDFQTIMAEEPDIQLLDVRTLEEFEDHHLPFSRHIALQELQQKLHEIDTRSTTYIICQTGKRSAAACELLRQKFPEAHFRSVRGGLNSYLALWP